MEAINDPLNKSLHSCLWTHQESIVMLLRLRLVVWCIWVSGNSSIRCTQLVEVWRTKMLFMVVYYQVLASSVSSRAH
jgi:hypothetical protein